MTGFIRHRTAAVLFLFAAVSVPAVTITGTDWLVHFNLPDQNTLSSTATTNEFAIRDRLLSRISLLQTNHEAFLATYTFSGTSVCCGAAGPILDAVGSALDRGAIVHMAVDKGVDTNLASVGGNSLASLAARGSNPLDLEVDDSPAGTIVHDKLGLFDYGAGNRWVFITSWNFTGGASSQQWNIGLDARSDSLYAAYYTEFQELMAGHFHDQTNKAKGHSGSSFSLTGSWGTNVVYFGPAKDATVGGTNILTEITNLIARASSSIVFALDDCSRLAVATQLVNAANRGVLIYGSMPLSETTGTETSATFYQYVTNAANYATTNVVHMLPAYAKADYSAFDGGEGELIHAKWMVLDPWATNAVLIHGSANWTDAAIVQTNKNDENVVVLRHRDIARVFYAHFKRITGAFTNDADFWMDAAVRTNGPETAIWTTDGGAYAIDASTNLVAPWTNGTVVLTGLIGRVTFTNDPALPARFYRAHRGTN